MTTEPEDQVTASSPEVDVEVKPEVQTESEFSEEDSLSGGAQRQRAGAAAAYAAAQHSAPSKHESEANAAEDQLTETAADGDPDRPEQQVQSDLDELAAKAEKAEEYLMLAQRTQADFENFRKRATRDAALAQERGIAKLARELLPAVDNLDRALQAAAAYVIPAAADADGDSSADDGQAAARGSHETQLIDGLKLVQAEVLAALARVGIEPFSPVGEPFDPQHHEAVAQHQFADQVPGTVVEVYQQGFRFGESVLRPARVLVAA